MDDAGSIESAECIYLHWASIVRAVVLFVLGAVVQSQWMAWRSGKAEQVDKTAEERKRNQSRQYPARARQEPSSVTADEKTQRPTMTKFQENDLETPVRWASYAASHYKNKSQTMCQDGTHSRGLRRESSLFFERTMGPDAAVTQDTSTFVRSRRNSAKPSRRDEAPTDVGRAGLQRSSSATSLLSFASPKRERRIPVKPLLQDETVTKWLRHQTTVAHAYVGSAGLQPWHRSGSSTSLHSNTSVSSPSPSVSSHPDDQRASVKPRRKEAKHDGKSSGTRFYADVVAKSRAELQGIRRSVSF